MDDILKGNFKVKNPVVVDEKDEQPKERHEEIAQELRKRTLSSLGGSIIYVERDKLAWDGDEQSEE